MGVPPVIIHFHWIFHEITLPFWGTPIPGNPHLVDICIYVSISGFSFVDRTAASKFEAGDLLTLAMPSGRQCQAFGGHMFFWGTPQYLWNIV